MIFFQSHRLLSHITTVETMDSDERGMNPVAMAIINHWKEYWQSKESNQRPPVLKPCMLLNYLWNSAYLNDPERLILYHIIPTYNNFEKEAFWKHCRKKRKCWQPAFFPLPTMFSTLPKTNFNFLVLQIFCTQPERQLDRQTDWLITQEGWIKAS